MLLGYLWVGVFVIITFTILMGLCLINGIRLRKTAQEIDNLNDSYKALERKFKNER